MEDLDVHLGAIAAGDDEAFACWLASAERPIRSRLRSFAGHVDTEAVLQETLLRVWQAARRVEPDGRSNALLRIALRIANNLAVSELRRARVDPREIEDIERAAAAGAEGAEPSAPDPMLRRAIEACLRTLRRKPALALRLRIEAAGGEADADLAARAGMRLNTFLQNFGRARKLLAACLAARGIEVPSA